MIGVVLAGLAIAAAIMVATGIVFSGGDGGDGRHRFVVATPDGVTFARSGPSDEAAPTRVPRSSGDRVRLTCRVEGPRDDRYWYRLEDGTFLPEDVLFPEDWSVSGAPPRC